MAETTGLPFEKKAIIPIDPRTKIFLTVTVSTIMVAGGTGGIMTVIRPCLMAFPMCLLLLSKRWKSVLKFSAMYAVLFALELTVLPLLTGTWNFVLGAAIGIYTHMLPGFIMGYYLIESTTVSEFVAAMERVHPARVWDYTNKHFSFSGNGPENPKNRKRVLACYRNPTFYFSLY